MDTENFADQATALAALHKVRDDLIRAEDANDTATDNLRGAVLDARPTGVLTVAEMAEALGRPRNFIDALWSTYGETIEGKQTRVKVDAGDDVKDVMARDLNQVSGIQRGAAGTLSVIRAER